MPDAHTLHPEIHDQGPRIREGLCFATRDERAYPWEHRPVDHNEQGLFIGGPEGEKVGWLRDINVGTANAAPTHETREAALQRMQEQKRRKLRLINAIFAAKRPRKAA